MRQLFRAGAALLAISLWFLAAPGGAMGADIYVNGKQVRGITDLTLSNCTVTFNTRGDVYISAPHFEVLPVAAQGEQATGQPSQEPGSFLRHRYFLFTQASSPGGVPYRFEILVNGKAVGAFTSEQSQTTLELTLHLTQGTNKLEIRSFYLPERSGSPADSFSILVGRGAPNGGSLEISNVLLNYTRKGNDSGDATDAYKIDVE